MKSRSLLSIALGSLLALTSCYGNYEYRGRFCEGGIYSLSTYYCKPNFMAQLTSLSHQASVLGDFDRYISELERNVKIASDQDRLYMLDELAQIYTYRTVNFQMALETNERAADLLKVLQDARPSVPQATGFYPEDRLLYEARTSQGFVFDENLAGVTYKENLRRVAGNIAKRAELLNVLLGETSKPPSLSIASIYLKSKEEESIWSEVFQTNAAYWNYYGKVRYLNSLWSQGESDWQIIRNVANDVLEQLEADQRLRSWHSSIRTYFMAGAAEISTGHFEEGLKKLNTVETLYGEYDTQLQDRIHSAQQQAEKQISRDRLTNVLTTIGYVVAAGLGGGQGGANALGAQGAFIGQGLSRDVSLQTNRAAVDKLKLVQSRGKNAFLTEHEQIALQYFTGIGLESAKRPAEAISKYKLAIDMIEQQRITITGEDQRIRFLEEKQRVYDRLIPLLMQQSSIEEAFAYMERARSRAFVDMLASGRPQFSTEEEAKAYRNEVQAHAQLDMLVQAQGLPRQEAQKALRGVSVVADENVEQEPAVQKSKVSREFRSLLAVQTAPQKEIYRMLGDDALIAFYVTNDTTAVVLLQDGRMYGWLKPVGREQLLERVSEFRRLLFPDRSVQRIQETAKSLFDEIGDAFHTVTKRSVYVVPHGPLHYFPFAAMYDGNQYLIDKHEILNIPSGTVLTYLEAKGARDSEKTFVFANPDLADVHLALPYAEQEAMKIQVHRREAFLNLGRSATEEKAREQAPSAGILHFATHATFDANNPLSSAILLSPGKATDGKLSVEEVFGLQLPGSLVVLSGCETGMGKVTSGDEIVGFTRAFMYAGAPHMIATLWPIEDAATSVFMDYFYGELSRQPVARALRISQIHIRSQYPHPFYWAPFTLFGAHTSKIL